MEEKVFFHPFFLHSQFVFLPTSHPMNLNKISVALAAILRHQAPSMKLTIDSGGFVPLQEILRLENFSRLGVNVSDIESLVEKDKKGRYSMENRDGVYWIKANQGHSFEVSELDLRRINDKTEFPVILHGTYEQVLPEIMEKGLSKMSRQFIHFASGLDSKSGIRKNCSILIYLNVEKCFADGIEFFVSPNGVILSKGLNDGGFIPSKYFLSVVNTKEEEK